VLLNPRRNPQTLPFLLLLSPKGPHPTPWII
jgi:hypothetical protein